LACISRSEAREVRCEDHDGQKLHIRQFVCWLTSLPLDAKGLLRQSV